LSVRVHFSLLFDFGLDNLVLFTYSASSFAVDSLLDRASTAHAFTLSFIYVLVLILCHKLAATHYLYVSTVFTFIRTLRFGMKLCY
jgi:hypothetical protein